MAAARGEFFCRIQKWECKELMFSSGLKRIFQVMFSLEVCLLYLYEKKKLHKLTFSAWDVETNDHQGKHWYHYYTGHHWERTKKETKSCFLYHRWANPKDHMAKSLKGIKDLTYPVSSFTDNFKDTVAKVHRHSRMSSDIPRTL